jgi:hypothetical protein
MTQGVIHPRMQPSGGGARKRIGNPRGSDTLQLGISPTAILGRGRATEQDRALHSQRPLGRASLALPSSPMIAGASAACFRRGRRPASGVRSSQHQMRRVFFASSVDRFFEMRQPIAGASRGQRFGLVSVVMPSRYDSLMTKPVFRAGIRSREPTTDGDARSSNQS